MPGSHLPPNKLADLYDALYSLLEALPAETHPAWELAIESVLFGGPGITPEVTPYGEQQAERNDFKISAYRSQYGNGERVTAFPTLTTRRPTGLDQQVVDEDLNLPVTPVTGTVLPILVNDETLPDAVRLLNEFPTRPGTETTEDSDSNLLNPHRLPGISDSSPNPPTANESQETEQSSPGAAAIPPNELADLYDGLYTVLDAMPADTHPRWRDAIESVLFDGAYLNPDASSYGEQQAERNDFGMPDYRSDYGDGDRVTTFPAIATTRPAGDDDQYVAAGTELPVTPESQTVLPIAPTTEDLPAAAQLLAEFPAEPAAEAGTRSGGSLFDIDAFTADIAPDSQADIEDTSSDPDSPAEPESSPDQAQPASQTESDASTVKTNSSAASAATDTDTDDDDTQASPTDTMVPQQESAGESNSTVPRGQQDDTGSESPRKYDDSQAERAHRRAQQRDPSDVVALGEEIRLTLKQVDYSSRPPTIMGTKNRLVVFVIDAPQDLSEYETIKATVVDYGGKNNSAEAAFSGYID